jgi:glutamine cyclotransferase
VAAGIYTYSLTDQTGLYPNPFSTTAVLKLSPETELTNAVLSVYDISGRLVSSVNNITSNDIIINRGNLKNGLYYYTLSDNGTIITKGKFIIAD